MLVDLLDAENVSARGFALGPKPTGDRVDDVALALVITRLGAGPEHVAEPAPEIRLPVAAAYTWLAVRSVVHVVAETACLVVVPVRTLIRHWTCTIRFCTLATNDGRAGRRDGRKAPTSRTCVLRLRVRLVLCNAVSAPPEVPIEIRIDRRVVFPTPPTIVLVDEHAAECELITVLEVFAVLEECVDKTLVLVRGALVDVSILAAEQTFGFTLHYVCTRILGQALAVFAAKVALLLKRISPARVLLDRTAVDVSILAAEQTFFLACVTLFHALREVLLAVLARNDVVRAFAHLVLKQAYAGLS